MQDFGAVCKQAEAVQAEGKLGEFLADVLKQVSPMIIPIIMALLSQWLKIPLPTPANNNVKVP